VLGSAKEVTGGELRLAGVLPLLGVADVWDPWPTCRSLALRAGALHQVHLAGFRGGFEKKFRK